MTWTPANPTRWAYLGLADPDPGGGMPADATTADVLAYAVLLPGAVDLVEGIVDGVRVELDALAELLGERRVSDVLRMLDRRLYSAMVILRRADEREPIPELMEAAREAAPESPPEAPEQTTTPAPAPTSLDDMPTQDALPEN